MRMRLIAAAGAATLVVGLVSAVTGASPAAASVSGNAASAVSYASSHGYRSSIGVLDTQTGSFTGAGDYNSVYASESVMKLFIATRLLMTGQMSGWNETTAYKMITQSDDASANALYGRTGGDSVIDWVKQQLNIPNLGSPPIRSGWWGGTRITAAGLASFYNAVRHRPGVWNWLGNAMHHATVYGSDGTYQFFGIPSATSGAAIKQGWGGDDAAGQPAFNSTGIVNGDRYAVVILTQGGSYGSAIAGMLTSEARLLMPGGRIAAADDPVTGFSSWSVQGRYLTVTGWAVDPNALGTPLTIVFNLNGNRFSSVASSVYRGDINSAFHASGNHGFSKTLALPDGTNQVCVHALNVGPGQETRIGCRTVPLSGSPLVGFSTISQHGNIATFTGWAFDYDAPGSELLATAGIGGLYAARVHTTVSRGDINGAFHGTGTHGFKLDVPLPAGTTTVCVGASNIGPGSPVRIGCHTFVVSTSPVGLLDSVTVQGNRATVTGWALDFNDPSRSIGVVINVGSQHAAWGPTTVTRSDVNSSFGVTGAHGFSSLVSLPAGASTVCVYAVNIGAGSNTLLGCRTVQAVAPDGATAPSNPAPSSQPPVTATPSSSAPASSAPASSTAPASSIPASSTAPAGSAPASTASASTAPSGN